MKKLLVALALLLATIGCCAVSTKRAPPSPALLGAWSGEARFLDRDLASEYGTFAVELELAPDGSATGTVGAATLVDGRVTERETEFLVEARLEGDVFATGSLPPQEKTHAALVLALPKEGRALGNLHLKSNPVFDFTLRVCALELELR